MLAEYGAKQKAKFNPEPFLTKKVGQSVYNTSAMDLRKLLAPPVKAMANKGVCDSL